MLRRALLSCVNVKPIRMVVIRNMATRLKDYTSYYDTLEINPECTKTEIREAWLRLSMQYHPDLNKDNPEANEKFMEIKEAYTTLINDEKRKAYNDKLGFYHSDPPPEFKREWTFQGEVERHSAAYYHVMWSEEAIRKLMASDKLRKMNWNKLPPSERLKILEAEKAKQYAAKEELERTGTLSFKEGSDRYMVMLVGVMFVCTFTYLAQRNMEGDDGRKLDSAIIEELVSKTDYITARGGVISVAARVDLQKELREGFWDNPHKPFQGTPGYREGLPVPALRPHQFQDKEGRRSDY